MTSAHSLDATAARRAALVVVGGGMVAHRLVEALRRPRRATGEPLARRRRSPRSRARPTTGSRSRPSSPAATPRTCCSASRSSGTTRGVTPAPRRRRSQRDRPRGDATVHGARRRVLGYDALVLATGSYAVRAAGAGQRPARRLRLPHPRRRRRRCAPGSTTRRGGSAVRCAAPSSAAGCSGSRRPARSPALGVDDDRRRVRRPR